MSIGEAIHIYRDFRKISPRDFSILVFVSEADIENSEKSDNNDGFTEEELIKLFQFFSMQIGVNSEEAHIKGIIAGMVSEEIRKRTGQN